MFRNCFKQYIIRSVYDKRIDENKDIKITFNQKGIDHIADDMLNTNYGISKKNISKLDKSIRKAKFVKPSDLIKGRKDDIVYFIILKKKIKNCITMWAKYYKDKKGVKLEFIT